MRRLGQLFAVMTWLLIGGSLIIITGGLFGRPLLLAAVPTGSMLPVLKPGDLIVVLPTWSMGAPGLDDVVVFKTPQDQNWIVHRIIDGNGTEGFVTMGDANPVSDPQRVFPKDIAGIVPQAGGKALRLPRMGAFRFANGPLSSPVVAGVALILGIYLLLMDASPEPRQRRFARSRTGSQRSRTILHAYAGLAVTAFLTTLIPAWTLSSDTDIAYEIVESRSTRATKSNRYLRGEEHKETVVIKNPSPLPLMVVFATADAHVHYEPWSALIPGRGEISFTATVANPNLGQHRAQLRMGAYLPVLPPSALAWLARQNLALAALATAFVPAAAVMGLAMIDQRSRLALAQLRVRWLARFSF